MTRSLYRELKAKHQKISIGPTMMINVKYLLVINFNSKLIIKIQTSVYCFIKTLSIS